MIDRGDYFTINRGRQYGKTMTIRALASYLSEDYFVISMDFQFVSHSDFVSESAFVRGFARELWRQRETREMIIPEIQSQIKSLKQIGVEYTFTLDFFPRTGKSLICSQRRISVETSQRMLSIQGYRGNLGMLQPCFSQKSIASFLVKKKQVENFCITHQFIVESVFFFNISTGSPFNVSMMM